MKFLKLETFLNKSKQKIQELKEKDYLVLDREFNIIVSVEVKSDWYDNRPYLDVVYTKSYVPKPSVENKTLSDWRDWVGRINYIKKENINYMGNFKDE